jgi:hypothetical protein
MTNPGGYDHRRALLTFTAVGCPNDALLDSVKVDDFLVPS